MHGLPLCPASIAALLVPTFTAAMPSVPPLPDQQDIAEISYTGDKVSLPSASTHIRLLELYPSTHGFDAASASTSGARSSTDESDSDNASSHYSSPLKCAISTTPIAAPRLFKALSYTWGTSGATHSIDVEGAHFRITASLDTALRHIRRKDESVTLWVDQICINQEDGAEKSKQVVLMTQIYSKADQVIIWLGPAENNSDALMECFQEIGQEARDLDVQSYLTKERLPLLHRIMRNEDPEDPVTIQYRPLIIKAEAKFKQLLHEMIAWNEREWFTRVWVIQEQALGTDPVFLCGYKTVNIDLIPLATLIWDLCISEETFKVPTEASEFRRLLLKAQDRRFSPLMAVRRRRRNLVKGVGPGDDFYHVLKRAYVDGDAQATRSRDRIYGLLSLATDAENLGITPDYVTEESHPTFIDAAHALVRVGCVEMLSFSQFPKDIEGLPSWVPDWRPTLSHSYLNGFEDADDLIVQAAGESAMELAPTDDRGVLGICGVTVDTIETTGDVWEWETGHESRYKLLQTIKTLCEEAAAKGAGHEIYENSDRQAEAMWRVPVADLYWTKGSNYHRPGAAIKSDYEDCMNVLRIISLTLEAFPPEERHQLLDDLYKQIPGQCNYSENMDMMTGKRPYMTRQGYLGMCPGEACPGDVVVILFGSRIPYVLRPSGDGTMYCFVGEAYCDGVMDGELLTKRAKTAFLIA
ncbi:heterokaryon incompatibility protein [Colletotrichum orchidophilum]|uniref:Heterokaryon incompatibility protein n=1 Tax=Colletotrichum orchidophilum TaxID=1209926 RepID=A0A1G4BK63_9PEZI|nr:heterokaryon incompatibility protein [Colletotrichum orchidophilum]OHF01725.1 heterokaryon incompatibility protein [Colletotrichum orchidophilum]